MSSWYIIYNGQQIGPMTKENIMAYNPSRDTRVWTEGMADWQPLYTVPELMELLNGMNGNPVYVPYDGVRPPMPPSQSYSPKDKTACGILALLLGSIGIQYFYLGKVGGGFLTILLTLVTCGLWQVITFIQGILMLTMSKEEFDRKYVFTNKVLPIF